MFEKLEIFSVAQALAKHGAQRQSVIARNVANADTPGYRARDLAEFSETYRGEPGNGMRATRAGHGFAGETGHYSGEINTVYRPDAASPNGNNVSLEQEVFAAARAKSAHDRALAVYGSAMKILRTSIGGRG
ncbi:FlgB family protein [Maritimibacter sp. HL-12]|uniref:FlgB family protein n=1 Tax=Maritimibacter sp. HL-12 TaxID=1162418 RepID=UPI000A0F3B00|nr:FlgB family protein [Maritimibacter sp. HL-12]SMH42755.1 flagellar basal-body rod protein FlgB [Maritimibacter sp. HL-12]